MEKCPGCFFHRHIGLYWWLSSKKKKKKIHLPMQKMQVWSLGWEDFLEEEMATHSNILAWEISWTEEPGRLQSMGSHRVKHDWATNTYLPCVPAIIFLLFTQEKEKHAHKNNHIRFLAALFTVNTNYEHTEMSTNRSMNKQIVAYPWNRITLINKKTELLISIKI